MRERKKIDCQNVTCKDALNITIRRGLPIITFPIDLDLLVLNSLQLSVWEMSPIEVFFFFSLYLLNFSMASLTKIG